jgi:hypothetical protein
VRLQLRRVALQRRWLPLKGRGGCVLMVMQPVCSRSGRCAIGGVSVRIAYSGERLSETVGVPAFLHWRCIVIDKERASGEVVPLPGGLLRNG